MIVKISKMREPTTQNAGTRKIEDPQEHCHKLESFAVNLLVPKLFFELF